MYISSCSTLPTGCIDLYTNCSASESLNTMADPMQHVVRPHPGMGQKDHNTVPNCLHYVGYEDYFDNQFHKQDFLKGGYMYCGGKVFFQIAMDVHTYTCTVYMYGWVCGYGDISTETRF